MTMKKILVVEDNTKNRVLIRDLLAYHGYEVFEAVIIALFTGIPPKSYIGNFLKI